MTLKKKVKLKSNKVLKLVLWMQFYRVQLGLLTFLNYDTA